MYQAGVCFTAKGLATLQVDCVYLPSVCLKFYPQFHHNFASKQSFSYSLRLLWKYGWLRCGSNNKIFQIWPCKLEGKSPCKLQGSHFRQSHQWKEACETLQCLEMLGHIPRHFFLRIFLFDCLRSKVGQNISFWGTVLWNKIFEKTNVTYFVDACDLEMFKKYFQIQMKHLLKSNVFSLLLDCKETN